jgi:hypothetical protein
VGRPAPARAQNASPVTIHTNVPALCRWRVLLWPLTRLRLVYCAFLRQANDLFLIAPFHCAVRTSQTPLLGFAALRLVAAAPHLALVVTHHRLEPCATKEGLLRGRGILPCFFGSRHSAKRKDDTYQPSSPLTESERSERPRHPVAHFKPRRVASPGARKYDFSGFLPSNDHRNSRCLPESSKIWVPSIRSNAQTMVRL